MAHGKGRSRGARPQRHFLRTQRRMQKLRFPDRQKPYIMAHRGNRVTYPENTCSAFHQAVLDSADIIETDVRLSSDGYFLCIHDDTIDRTTDGSGCVAELKFEEIRSYNAAASRPDLPAEPIPTIGELAQVVPKPIVLAFELKSDAFLDPGVCQRFSNELHEKHLHERSIILSFSAARLRCLRSVDPRLPIGWITVNRPWPQTGMDMLGPLWPLLFLNPLLTVIAHLMGQLVCPLDPTPEARLLLYRLLGCDAVLSDDPGKTARALGRLSR
jgi:glycerophosphoryl diester phosphodiesterase